MNNGQTGSNDTDNRVFFTAGVGDQAPVTNPDSEGSFNTDSFVPESDPRKFGNNAMNAIGIPGEGEIPNVGQFDMPPGYRQEEKTDQNNLSEPTEENNQGFENYKTDGERVEAAIKAVGKYSDNPAELWKIIRAGLTMHRTGAGKEVDS